MVFLEDSKSLSTLLGVSFDTKKGKLTDDRRANGSHSSLDSLRHPPSRNSTTPTLYTSIFGDMCNNIGFCAFSSAVKLWLEAHYPDIQPQIVLQENFHGKEVLLECMPVFRGLQYKDISHSEIELQSNVLKTQHRHKGFHTPVQDAIDIQEV